MTIGIFHRLYVLGLNEMVLVFAVLDALKVVRARKQILSPEYDREHEYVPSLLRKTRS
jgi:hypothetical protein